MRRPPYSSHKYISAIARPFSDFFYYFHLTPFERFHSFLYPALPGQSTGTRRYLIHLANAQATHCIAFTWTFADHHTRSRCNSWAIIVQATRSAPADASHPLICKTTTPPTRPIFEMIVERLADYKAESKPTVKMILRESESNNMGRGAYDTTGTPKPPPPPPK